MACNPSTLTNPLGLYVKGEAHNGADIPMYGNEMAMRFPTMPNFMARQRNFIESAIQKAEAQRQLEWMAKYYIVAYAAATGSGARFEGTDARTLLKDLQNGRAFVNSTGQLVYYMQGVTETNGYFGFDPELEYETYISEVTFKRDVINLEKKSFWKDNWKDMAFMANDVAQALTNSSSLNAALRMGRSSTMIFTLGRAIPVATKLVNRASNFGRPIARAAPWVAGALIVNNVVNTGKITAGDVYQSAILGLSLIPGWGLAVGGISLLAEGISYYYTGKSISDNINESLDGGVIHDFNENNK